MREVDWNRIAFMCALFVVGGLVYKGQLHAEVLVGLLTWLAPSPMKPLAAPPAGPS